MAGKFIVKVAPLPSPALSARMAPPVKLDDVARDGPAFLRKSFACRKKLVFFSRMRHPILLKRMTNALCRPF
jgi:hypothetical protein